MRLLSFILLSSIAAAQSPPPILIQGAVAFETGRLIDSIHRTRTDTIGAWTFVHGTVDGYPVILSRTMMGSANAAAATALAIDRYHPRAIINAGTAGGHDPELHNGDIVIGLTAVNVGAFRTPPRTRNAGSSSLEWTSMDLTERKGDRDSDMHEGSLTTLTGDPSLVAAAHARSTRRPSRRWRPRRPRRSRKGGEFRSSASASSPTTPRRARSSIQRRAQHSRTL